MSGSTPDPDNLPPDGKSRERPKGHDTKTLGPSDSSDSGSDMAGPGLIDDDAIALDRGTNEDTEAGDASTADAGPSVGDVDMDSNSDRFGTGERRAAGKDPRAPAGNDVDTDEVVGPVGAGLGGGLDQAEEAQIGITDEEIEAELGITHEPFEVDDETKLPPSPRKKR